MGFGWTLLGIAGSFVGGFLGNAISGLPMFELRTGGFLGSLMGAVIIVAIVVAVQRRPHPAAV